MTEPEIPQVGFPKLLDSTIMVTYDACPEKFHYQYVLKLATYATSPDLHAGGAFAKGIEGARRAFWFQDFSPEESLMIGFDHFMGYWGMYEPPPKLDIKTGNYTNHAKDFTNTAGAYFDYFREYPLETDPIKPYIMAGDQPAIEFTFGVPIPINHPDTGEPIIYAGRCDMLGHYNNLLAVVDEKTTGSIGQKWAQKWRMRGQFLGYCWAAQKYGIPAKYALIRGVAIQKTQYVHAQAIESVSDWRIERWYENLLRRVQNAVDDYTSGKYNLSYGDACESYGGCMFLDLCTSRKPEIWFSNYARREWNPLHVDPTDTKDSMKEEAV